MDRARSITLYILTLGVIILFLPGIFSDAFSVSKILLILIGFIALLLYWGYQIFTSNAIKWRSTPFDGTLIMIGAAYVLSTLIASPNKIGTLISPDGSGFVLITILLYFLIVQTYNPKSKPVFKWLSTASGFIHGAIIISFWSIANLILELTNISFQIGLITFPTNITPIGNLLTQAAFLLIIFIYTGLKVSGKKNSGAILGSAIILIGLLTTSYKLSTLTPFPLLPYQFGWSIAVDSLKNSPIFGVGPANFISAFTRFKPITMGSTDYWNIDFGMSSNYYLHILTTIGTLGLATYLTLTLKVYNIFKKDNKHNKELKLTLLSIFAIQLLVPFNLTLLFVEIVLLSLLGISMSGPRKSVKFISINEEDL